MIEIFLSIFKYIFIFIIYIFIFSIIRLIYLDIRAMGGNVKKAGEKYPYIKLINRREKFNFKVEESYILDGDKGIGRSGKNEISVQDPYMSGKHALFYWEKNKCMLKDLDSTNGTLVNDEAIEDDEIILLEDGDRIHIGQLDFIYVNDGK